MPEQTTVRGKAIAYEPLASHLVSNYAEGLNLPPALAELLLRRNVKREDVGKFLNPTLREAMPDPNHLLDMQKAVERIAHAITKQEKITVFGDYDVDGTCATALFMRYLEAIGHQHRDFYIPDRVSEGYGPNSKSFEQIAKSGTNLLITVDCGTTSFAPIQRADELGMDVIVLDHHLSAEELPPAEAVVNPNRLDETSPERGLCATGVVFFTLAALQRHLRKHDFFANQKEPNLIQWLDMVALATVCDVMPLTGTNRAFVAQGLKRLQTPVTLGMKALAKLVNLSLEPSTYHLGFALGPRINAGGRIGACDTGVKLLLSNNEEEAENLATQLDLWNKERQTLEKLAVSEAETYVITHPSNTPFIFLSDRMVGTSWHQGIIGLIAGRLKERFDKPTLIMCSVDQPDGTIHYKGSCRSVVGVDIGSLITSAKQQDLLLSGGGHKMAAGFTVEANKLEAFEANLLAGFSRMEQTTCDPVTTIDAIITPAAMTPRFAAQCEQMAPFGESNPEPKMLLQHATIERIFTLTGGHMKIELAEANHTGAQQKVKAMAFRAEGKPLGTALIKAKGKPISVVGKIITSRYNGVEQPEFHIEDMVVSE
jgi:single-stranded-DNA-specific exonuclease